MGTETKMFKAIKESSGNGWMKTAIAVLVGGAVAWGTLRSQVNDLRNEANDNKVYLRQIDQRLSRIEGALKIEIMPFSSSPSPLGIQNKK